MIDLKVQGEYIPKLVIVVYQKNETPAKFYLESHEIKTNQGEKFILEGRPLKQETIGDIVEALAKERKYTLRCIDELLPENIIYLDQRPGKRVIIWWSCMQAHELFFDKQLNIKNGKAWCPTMLFVSSGHDLSCFMLTEDKRPTLETKLFNAPFHNIYESGSVCLGDAEVGKTKEEDISAYMKEMEDAFWDSEFTSLHNPNDVFGTSLVSFWNKQVKDYKEFPKNTGAFGAYAIPAKHKTLEKLIGSL